MFTQCSYWLTFLLHNNLLAPRLHLGNKDLKLMDVSNYFKFSYELISYKTLVLNYSTISDEFEGH